MLTPIEQLALAEAALLDGVQTVSVWTAVTLIRRARAQLVAAEPAPVDEKAA